MLRKRPQHQLEDILERWSEAASPKDAFNVYAETIAEFGYDQVNYVDLGEYVSRGEMSSRRHEGETSTIAGFDAAWMDYYLDRDYGPLDPVFSWVAEARGPFRWADAESTATLTRPQFNFMRESEDAGLRNGFSVPLRGPEGRLSALFAAGPSKDSIPLQAFRLCSLLGQHFHNVGMALENEAQGSSGQLQLTTREREVLLWCAKGKSNWAIGEILGISGHSVKFHLRNICQKLGVDSRIAAVVKAIRIGLIQS